MITFEGLQRIENGSFHPFIKPKYRLSSYMKVVDQNVTEKTFLASFYPNSFSQEFDVDVLELQSLESASSHSRLSGVYGQVVMGAELWKKEPYIDRCV